MKEQLIGYRQVSDLKEMQRMLQELFLELHRICEENGLIYSMFGGTLLGAVRHQDIIPWDDDIDISMPRTDYERLINIVREKYAEDYEIMAYPQENYIYPYAKFCKKGTVLIEESLKKKYNRFALYIDIFPMDGIPDMPEKEMTKRFKNAEKNRLLTALCAGKNQASPCWWKKPFIIVKWLRSAILNIWGYQFFLNKQVAETTKYSFEENENVGFVSPWGGNRRGVISKEAYMKRRLYKFGQNEFWGVEDYHMSLTNWYGDYMTPPPEDKRKQPHSYSLYVKE